VNRIITWCKDAAYYWDFSVSKVYRAQRRGEQKISATFGDGRPTEVFAPFKLFVELMRGEQEIDVSFSKDGAEVECRTFMPEDEQGERLIHSMLEFRGTRRFILLSRKKGVTTEKEKEEEPVELSSGASPDDGSQLPPEQPRNVRPKGY
jgi:hypothetical protein